LIRLICVVSGTEWAYGVGRDGMHIDAGRIYLAYKRHWYSSAQEERMGVYLTAGVLWLRHASLVFDSDIPTYLPIYVLGED
jgi:hypothetical protein